MEDNTTSFVYAIQSTGLKLIKLGSSIDPEKRLRGLQTGSPEELEIIACWFGTAEDEHALQDQLVASRTLGEWFYPSEAVMYEIKSRNIGDFSASPGKMRIIISDSQVVEYAIRCRNGNDSPNGDQRGTKAISTIISQAEYFKTVLPSSHANVAQKMINYAKGVLLDFELTEAKIGELEEENRTLAGKPNQQRGRLRGDISCDFCGKEQSVVKKLVAGPDCYVCNECIDICNEIIADDKRAEQKTAKLKGHRNAYLIKNGEKIYCYTGRSKKEVLDYFFQDRVLNDGMCSIIAILQMPDDRKFGETTYRERADAKHGFAGEASGLSPATEEDLLFHLDSFRGKPTAKESDLQKELEWTKGEIEKSRNAFSDTQTKTFEYYEKLWNEYQWTLDQHKTEKQRLRFAMLIGGLLVISLGIWLGAMLNAQYTMKYQSAIAQPEAVPK